jgi:tripartite-type tricarboxylate transporter receptor subunit TctC
MNRRSLIRSAAAISATTFLEAAFAQERGALLRIVVPYAAGGQTDLLARALAQSLAKSLDRSVVVENKTGAAALIGTRAVQTAAPDGNTLLFHNSGFVALPLLTKAHTYDPVKDFAPVALVGYGPNFLMINGNVPARTLPEFIAWAKTQPEGIEASNAGLGSAGHLATLLFAKRAGIKVVHVAYKGTSETQTALIAGEVKMQLTSATEVMTQQAKLGKIRMLAVNSKARTSLAPEVPTIAETLPGFANDVWFGLMAPAASPADQVQRLSEALRKALDEPEIRTRFIQNYMDPIYRDPKEFGAAINESLLIWKSMINELGIEPN